MLLRAPFAFLSFAVFNTRSVQRQTVSRGETSARTVFQRTTKGDVSLKECAIDGTHIVLENTGIKKQDISGWTIKRDIDGGHQIVNYIMPAHSTLEPIGPKKTLTIWSKGRKPKDSKDLECNDKSWGIATKTALTVLSNEKGEERATNTAKTTYGDDHHH